MSSTRTLGSEWASLAARVLGIPAAEVARRAGDVPFIVLGGTSLRAAEFVALAERSLGRSVNLTALLGTEPLADVVSTAQRAPERAPIGRPAADDALRFASASQESMVLGEEVHGGTAFHLLFSAEVRGPLDERRLRTALQLLTDRHEALRSVFVSDRGELRVRVLPRWTPRLLRPSLPPDVAGEAVEAVHRLLAAGSGTLLKPFERPPVVFALNRVTADHWIVTLLVHHAVVDGWSIGILLRELVTAYTDGGFPGPAPSPDLVVALEEEPPTRQAVQARRGVLRDAPFQVEIPSDLRRPDVFDRKGVRLHFPLPARAQEACEGLARACGVTRNVALLAAWALVVGRRAGIGDLLVGVASAGRPTADLQGVVGLCTKLMPIRCRTEAGDTVRAYLDRLGAEFRAGLDAGAAPVERVASGLGPVGDLKRTSLTQIVFAAHDELVPDRLGGDDLSIELHEGHCGGTVFDAILYVQRWGARSRLAIEYASSVVGPAEAAGLAGELATALVEMSTGLDQPLSGVRGVPPDGRDRLAEYGAGRTVDAAQGLWQLVAAGAAARPDAVAVSDGRSLTYAQLHDAVERQSADLYAAGVRDGDHVALAVERSAQEIVAVLAILRLGAAYIGVDAGAPPAVTEQQLRIARPRAVLGTAGRADELATLSEGMAPVAVRDPWSTVDGPAVPPAAPADPGRIAYVAFTSGSTGTPKGVRVPHRAVARLALDPDLLAPGVTDRFLRLAPLAFDASTLEIFAPLVAGGSVEVYPHPHVVPGELAEFLADRRVTGLWLTSGLFRLVADDRPAAFRTVKQLLTGGDVVPPVQARRVLEHSPGLRLTNGYGPTENTTFTTVHHVDDAVGVDDPLPIGRPIAGTTAMVLDSDGALLPVGAVGELCVSGDGLAVDYLGAPEETARAFVAPPDGPRYYRTGDLVRWDGEGRLRYIGRRDQQVKIRGFRVELAAVAQALRGHPRVRDAVVAATTGGVDRRLVAGIVGYGTEPDPDLVAALRGFATQRLPAYAVPSLWAVVGTLPVTANGKVDVAKLVSLASEPQPPQATHWSAGYHSSP